MKQLEEDKSVLQARAQGWEVAPGEIWENPNSPGENPHLGGRPEAVVRALQVLEVREQLEREGGHDGEKALVREMCNVSLSNCSVNSNVNDVRACIKIITVCLQVVWRKLEEGPQTRH